MNRQQRARTAQETLHILESGSYRTPDNRTVVLGDEQARACAGTVLCRPADYDTVLAHSADWPRHASTTITVSNQTTLAAARALHADDAAIACLNFASAKNPGRGFLSGSQAQEESLARASGLYATLQTQPAFYAYHRQLRTSLYSDHAIFSPCVPVFRDDADRLLEHPWQTAFIAAAAVNAGAIARNEPQRRALIVPAMEQRARMVLGIAASHGYDALVLGAWGCGVFQNDPPTIAAIWARVLAAPPFAGRFGHVAFAVYDTTREQRTLVAFRDVFG